MFLKGWAPGTLTQGTEKGTKVYSLLRENYRITLI
jgi:hypothetical protein